MSVPKSVVITGASTGIGRACALHLDRLGWRVFAGIRKEADGAELKLEASSRLTPLFLDVTDTHSIREAEKTIAASVAEHGLTGLVNNAGIPFGGPIEMLELDQIRRVFEVNFFGLIAVTQALIPHLRKGHGRIVNMSSISGLVASPFLSPYSTSKFALEALSDALRVELHPWDIQVAVVEPGAIHTPIWNKGADVISSLLESSQNGMELYSGVIRATQPDLKPHGISADHVAKSVAHALTSSRPKTRYAVGPDATLVRIFKYLPDRIRDSYFLSRLTKW